MDPVPAPVFNISWAIFFIFFPPLSGVVCLSHTLSGNVYVSLEFAGRGKTGGDKDKFVYVTARHGYSAVADR